MPGKVKKPQKVSRKEILDESNNKTAEVTLSSEEQQQMQLEQQLMDNARFMSILMIDGAMRFREIFWQEDIEANNKVTNAINKALNKEQPNGWESMVKRNLINNKVFKAKHEKINEVLSQVIEAHTMNLKPEELQQFQNFVVGIKIMIEEYLNAKDSAEIVTLVKLYNGGMLDGVFQRFKDAKPESVPDPNSDNKPNDLP
jgi:hypothetical protein